MSKEPAPQKKEVFAVDYVAECEKSLSTHLGRGVKIVNGKRKFDRRVEEEELHDKNYGLDVKKAQSESFMRYRKNIKG